MDQLGRISYASHIPACQGNQLNGNWIRWKQNFYNLRQKPLIFGSGAFGFKAAIARRTLQTTPNKGALTPNDTAIAAANHDRALPHRSATTPSRGELWQHHAVAIAVVVAVNGQA